MLKRFVLLAVAFAGSIVCGWAQNENSQTDSIDINDTHELEEVVITHQAPVVKMNTDKVTYQVSNDVEAKTKSVLEMLRKVPMVNVDGRNNITVNGSAQFKVYVDGRLSSVITRNPKQTLRSMPASQVKSIEVITNPGAQYDAEGSGGVLLITTKKGGAKQALAFAEEETDEALCGSVHATMGLLSRGIDANLSGQKGKWSYDMNLNAEHMQTSNSTMESEVVTGDTRQWSFQKSTSKMPFAMGEFGLGYEIDNFRSLHASFTTMWFGMHDNGMPTYNYSGGMWGKEMAFSGSQLMKMDEVSVDGSIDYQRRWGDKGRFALNYQVSHAPNRNDSENRYEGLPSGLSDDILYILRNNRTEMRDRTTQHMLTADVSVPMGENHTLNTGAKMTLDKGESKAKEMTEKNGAFVEQEEEAVHFSQLQSIAALYAEWDAKWSWFGMKDGLRYEYTWQNSSYKKGNGTDFSVNYGDLVPSTTLSAKVSESSSFGLNYTMRIRRPMINELDPYINKSDPTQLSYGNPHLDAQHLNTASLVYTLSLSKLAMRLNLNQAWSNDGIDQYKIQKDGRLHSTFGNIAKTRRTSLGSYISWSITSGARLMLNSEVGYSDMRSDEIDAHNKGWSGNVSVGWQQNLPWKMKWSTDMEWMSPMLSLQGKSPGMTMVSGTLSRSFCNDKWDVAISGMSGLWHGGKMIWEENSVAKDFCSMMRFVEPTQDLTISITYTFGGAKRPSAEEMDMFGPESNIKDKQMSRRRR